MSRAICPIAQSIAIPRGQVLLAWGRTKSVGKKSLSRRSVAIRAMESIQRILWTKPSGPKAADATSPSIKIEAGRLH